MTHASGTDGAPGKIGRNAPCFCGSGKKFKKCHLGRADAAPAKPFEVFAPLMEAARRRTCWHRGVDGTACSRQVVKAHTVPRAMSLMRIAEEGHVMGIEHSIPGSGLELPHGIARIGVRNASTFLGFCSEHDGRVFAPLETQPFTASPEQLWLAQYRSICRELYSKQATTAGLAEARHKVDRGRSVAAQRSIQRVLGDMLGGTDSGLAVLRTQKARFDEDYRQRDWGAMRGIVVWFAAAPPVMCSGLVAPDFDFAGAPLPDSSGTDLPDDLVSLDVLGTEGGGAAVVAWREESRLPGEALARSLLVLGVEAIPDALVRLVFEGTSNWFARPSWWADLPAAARQDLERRLLCVPGVHTPRCLAARTARYGTPAVSGIERVGWDG